MHPLSFGQLSVFRFIERTPGSPASTNLTAEVSLPPGTSVPDVRHRLAELMARHESLRTSYRWCADPGQVVHPPDRLAVPEVKTIEAGDAAAVDRLRDRAFTLTDDLGWQPVVLLERGRPAALILVLHHMVTDGWSVRTLEDELNLGAALTDSPAPATSPRELAHAQRSPEWESRRQAVLRHWDAIASTGLLPVVDSRTSSARSTTRLSCALPLRSIASGVLQLAADCQVSPSTVLLALNALEIAGRLGRRRFVMWLMCANRTSPRLRTVVTSMNQRTPMVLAIEVSETAREFIQRVQLDSLTAQSRGCYDPDQVTNRAIASLGGEPIVEYLYNYAVTEWPAAARDTEPSPVVASRKPAAAGIYIVISAGAAPAVQLHADETVLDPTAIVDHLRGVRTRLDRIRRTPDVSLGALLDA